MSADTSHSILATIAECKWSVICKSVLLRAYISVRHVHWLCAWAQMNCWQEECHLLTYEMQWTVQFFVHKSSIWHSFLIGASHGLAAYATWQAALWTQLAHCADQAFQQNNVQYRSPLTT